MDAVSYIEIGGLQVPLYEYTTADGAPRVCFVELLNIPQTESEWQEQMKLSPVKAHEAQQLLEETIKKLAAINMADK